MLTYLQRIEWFIGLVLLQVLVLNHMHINGYATPFFLSTIRELAVMSL